VLISLDELSELVDAGAALNVKMERLAEAQKLQVWGLLGLDRVVLFYGVFDVYVRPVNPLLCCRADGLEVVRVILGWGVQGMLCGPSCHSHSIKQLLSVVGLIWVWVGVPCSCCRCCCCCSLRVTAGRRGWSHCARTWAQGRTPALTGCGTCCCLLLQLGQHWDTWTTCR
jgi:hypothetical protein